MLDWVKKSGLILAGVIASGCLLLPLYAHALGFGNIKVKSSLNEPLDAEIELLSATDDEVKDLEVKLASREAFLRAGVDRSNQLTQIKFSVSKRNGKYYIVAKTPQSVREPFLNFLLEMNWKNGRMLREYTVLLDPPDRKPTQVAAAEPALPAVAPKAEPAPAPAVEPVATPFVAPSTVETAKGPEPAEVKPAEATPAPAAEVTPAAAPEAKPTETAKAAEEPTKPVEKKSKKKKSKKGAKVEESATKPAEPLPSAEPAKAAEPPVPAAEPAKAPEASKPTEVATATTTPAAEPGKSETLSPNVPLDESGNTDAKALEEAIKQSEAAHKAGGEAAPAGEVLPSATPATPAAEPVPAPTTEVAKAPDAAPAPAPTVDEKPSKPTEAAAPAAGSMDYGITRKGDNLWTIAGKVKAADDVTIYQVMMALQQSNPDAFVKGNIHRLKANQVMRIEDPRLLTAMTKKQAATRYQEQTREWQDYLASVGAQVPRQGIVAGDAGGKPEEAGGVPAGELTLTPPSGEGAGSGGSDKLAKNQNTQQLRKEVQKAVAEAENERRKNTELASRVTDLEKELKRLENLVTVKDSDLAALQRKLEEVQKARASKASKTAEPTPAPVVQEPPKPEVKPEPMVAAPTPAPEPVKPATTEVAAAPTPAPVVAEASTKPATEQVSAPAPKEATPAVQPVAPTKSEGIMGMLTGILGGMGLYLALGGAVILVLLLVFVWIRNRNKVHFQESILKGGTGTDSKLNSVIANDSPISQTSAQSSLMTGGESSFLSDFAISGVSAIQAEDSEVDPLTEADVFMAYGRYEAAEERLNEAIKQDPKRGELRVKLLELYTTTKNKKSFETAAEDYYASLNGQTSGNALWQKVVSMGADIAPNNPLFAGGGGGGMNFSNTSNLNSSKVMDIGLNTGTFTKNDFSGGANKAADAKGSNAGMDFNLDFDDKTVIPPKKAAPASENTENSLDFNLDFGGSMPAAAPTKGTAADNGGGLDFSLDLAKDEEPTATDIKFDAEDHTSTLDFDLESPGPSSGGASSSSNRPTMEMNLEASDSMALDMPSGGDEVGTKLDLARAYIDMGDPDGARSILDEVIAEGNEGQKQEARQLMQQIG